MIPDESELQAVEQAWLRLEARERAVLRQRAEGKQFRVIGAAFDFSRQRAHQMHTAAAEEFIRAVDTEAPAVRERIAELRAAAAVEETAVRSLAPPDAEWIDVLIDLYGFVGARVWGGPVAGWFTARQDLLSQAFELLISVAPCDERTLEEALLATSLPRALVEAGLRLPSCPVMATSFGWARRARLNRDSALLYLRAEAEPRESRDIAAALGNASQYRAISERLRTDPEFVQLRPEGTWALRDWNLQRDTLRYSDATEAVIDVLRELGPMSLERLRSETQARYPVSGWRVQQCLSRVEIGRTTDGLYDLAERGAMPIEDHEPARPEHVRLSDDGLLLGFSIVVDGELLRGSGLGIHRWVTWQLGLRNAPTARSFRAVEFPDESVTIRRGTSGSSVSSLRVAAGRLGVVIGCTLVVLLRTDVDTGEVHHVCPAGDCPARIDTGE